MSDGSDAQPLAPDEAFAALGNGTRMEILRALAGSEGPLSFSELRERVGMRDSGQFNYHLDTLEGHFVDKTDGTYELRQAGRQVIGAVLSGAITDSPVIEPTPIESACPVCGAETLVAFWEGRVEHYCSECAGYYGRTVPSSEQRATDTAEDPPEYGYLGSFQLPPAGTEGRSPAELYDAASTWGLLKLIAVASGVCPQCSARLDSGPRICEEHEAADGHCEHCDNRHAVQLEFRCTNCLYGGEAAFVVGLLADGEVLAFLATHGVNPVSPSDPAAYSAAIMNYEEELVSADPFEARFTLALDGDELSIAVGSDLNVVEVTEN
jgi:DNA-binding HxlR family transcriptional regulator